MNLRKKASDLELQTKLEPENDKEGNVEYKIYIKNIEDRRFHKLATQMSWRISEGRGMCFYFIGISDDGTPRGISRGCMEKSINNLINITNYLGYSHEIIYFKKGISGGFCAKIFIINNNSSASYN